MRADQRPRFLTGRAVLFDGIGHRTSPDSIRKTKRCGHVAYGDFSSFEVITLQQRITTPTLDSSGELPAEVGHIIDSGIEAKATGRRKEMSGIAGEEEASVRHSACNQALTRAPIGLRMDDKRELAPESLKDHLFDLLFTGRGRVVDLSVPEGLTAPT